MAITDNLNIHVANNSNIEANNSNLEASRFCNIWGF